MTLFSSQPGDEGLPGPARARVMAAIMTTTLMGVFDGTMINIALPSMAQEMQVSGTKLLFSSTRASSRPRRAAASMVLTAVIGAG